MVSYLPAVLVLLPAALIGSRWYAEGKVAGDASAPGRAEGTPVPFRLLLPLCLVMAFAYIGDSTVSNWSAKYLQDVWAARSSLRRFRTTSTW